MVVWAPAAGGAAEAGTGTLPPLAPEVAREFAALPAGRLSLLTAGHGAPVVLLHGIPTSAELWRPLLAPLAAAGMHVLAPDLPGYGSTRLPARADYSLGGAADVLAGWLRGAGLAPAWVVGHDAGGAVAQLLAVRAPDTVTRLTLVNSIADGSWPAPRARVSTLLARAGLYRPAARLGAVPNGFMRREIARGFADASLAARFQPLVWDTKVTDPAGRAAFERHLAALTARDTAAAAGALHALTVPSQLVWGMADPFQPWAGPGRRLRALLPSASVHLLEGCGHFVPLECSPQLLTAMLELAP